MMAGVREAPAWYEEWFGEEYLAIYPHRDGREADKVVGFLQSRLNSRRIDRVLDLACGAGRHSRALGKLWWTTGFDLSEPLLKIARKEAREACYVRGDMRVLPFRENSFSLVVNLFTSFGYFSDDRDHELVLRGVNHITSQNGTFVLDYLNAARVRDTLNPSDERTVNGIVVEQQRSITDDGRFVEKRIKLRDKNKTFVERVRLFSRDDLERMVRDAGFEVEDVVGDYAGSPWTTESERAMLVCVKQ